MNHSSKFCAFAIPMTSINFFQPKRKKIIFYFPSALNFDYLHGFVKCLHVSISGILLVYIMWPNYSNQFCAPAIDCRFTFFFFNQDLFALAYHLIQCDEVGARSNFISECQSMLLTSHFDQSNQQPHSFVVVFYHLSFLFGQSARTNLLFCYQICYN